MLSHGCFDSPVLDYEWSASFHILIFFSQFELLVHISCIFLFCRTAGLSLIVLALLVCRGEPCTVHIIYVALLSNFQFVFWPFFAAHFRDTDAKSGRGFIFVDLFEGEGNRGRHCAYTNINLLSAAPLSKFLQQLGLDQVKTKSQQSNSVSHMGGRDQVLLPAALQGTLAGSWNGEENLGL